MKRKIYWDKVALMIFCSLLIIFMFKALLIPMVFSMFEILLNLVDLYQLLEMPYLFFGSALFLFIVWYFFSIFCDLTYRLFKFVLTTKVSSLEKEKKSK